MKYDYCVVGAGFSGSVMAERISRVLKKKVLVVEAHSHFGGHVYDAYDPHGILIQVYGPHIFHTKYKDVWDYLSDFTEWNLYHHEVIGLIDGKKVPIPFNLNTLHSLFPSTLALKLEAKLIEKFGFGNKVTVLELKKSEDSDLKTLGDFVYEKVFLNYTIKQWGLKPEDLSPSVTGRVPVFISRDNRYFQDPYQGMPSSGFAPIFNKLLDDKNISVLLNTDFLDIKDEIDYKHLIYTGPIDSYFNFKYGKLPYRTLDFEWIHIDREYYQEIGVINYPNDYTFTRITEFKHLTGQKSSSTTIIKEYPRECDIERDIPYYPVPRDENQELYKKYEGEAGKIKNATFIGRLATYNYYNMDQAIHNSLLAFEKLPS
jgi:UDP-galactopyranose mutase